MGIVRFYAFVKKTYPQLIQQAFKLPDGSYVEGLYVDLNSPVHGVAQKLFKYGLDRKLTPADLELQNKFRAIPVEQRMQILFTNIGRYLFYCYSEVKPAKVFMYALDGVAPKAKMVQQRLRRFKPSGAPLDFFDPVVISPGTKFMDALDKYLTFEWPALYKDKIAEGVKVIFSSHREPGEGEHKIFEQMGADIEGAKRVKTTSSISRGFSKPYQVVVGADADLIILSLSRPHNIIFMRDGFPDNKDRDAPTYLEEAINASIVPPCLPQSQLPPDQAYAQYIEAVWQTVFKKGFEYVNIGEVREQLLNQYIHPNDITDFSFIAMFVGNDFLPALPEMEAVTVNGIRAMTDDDIELRFMASHQANLRAKSSEVGAGRGAGRGRGAKREERNAGPPFDSDKFWILFREKERTWTSVANAKTGYLEFPAANGLLNHQKNRYEIFPLLPEPLTGVLRRYMYSRPKLDEKQSGRINVHAERSWRPSREDMGAIITSLILYAKLQKRIRGKMRGGSNVFLVENKTNLNYFNLMTYLREIELNAMAYMEAQALNYNDLTRLKRIPDKLIRLSIGVDEGNRRQASYVPAAFSSLNRALSFGIYDSKYADARLPKQQIDEMCRKWLEGVHWTLKYYSDGPRSINTRWFYPYEHAPSVSDLLRFIERNMVVNIPGYPGIFASINTDTVTIEKINVDGIVRLVPKQVMVANEQGQQEEDTDYVPVTNREFTGVISIYEDEERRQVALMKTRDGAQKFIDLSRIQFIKETKRLGNIPRPTPTVPTKIPPPTTKIPPPTKKQPTIPLPGKKTPAAVPKQAEPTPTAGELLGVEDPQPEAIDPTRITLIESGRTTVSADVTRTFKLATSIIQLISDVSYPYATVVESFFSIMPERTLKMMMSVELVNGVIEQIGDAFPPEFEMITEGLYYENAEVPKIPFLSPTRLERALDALPDTFNVEIQRFNGRKKRIQIMLRGLVIDTRVVAIAQGALGAGSPNIEARTLKRQDFSSTGRKGRKKKGEEEAEAVMFVGGYGDALGGVLPQYLSTIKELLDLPAKIEAKTKITPAEGAELAKFANPVFQFPSQVLMPTDLPINYNVLPTILPYREEGIPKQGSVQTHSGQRKLLINEIIFLTKFGHLAKLVVYIGAAPGEHFQIVSRMFPTHEFHLWDPSKFNVPAAIRKDTGQGNVVIFNRKFTHQEALGYRNRGVKLLFISDLRILLMGVHAPDPTPKALEAFKRSDEAALHNDNIFQMQLVNIMNPVRAMLKFRLPFTEIGENYLYPLGQIWVQPWAKPTSAETRLILSEETVDAALMTPESAQFSAGVTLEELAGKPFMIQRITRYTLSEYESKLYYHNLVVRRIVKIQNSLGLTNAEVPALKQNFDGAYEVYAWDQWLLTKYPASTAADRKGAVAIIMNEATTVIGKDLDFKTTPRITNRLFTINF